MEFRSVRKIGFRKFSSRTSPWISSHSGKIRVKLGAKKGVDFVIGSAQRLGLNLRLVDEVGILIGTENHKGENRIRRTEIM